MQSAYTFYIFGLNLIFATFSDQAVTALGLYYKWQTFFFIPLGVIQTCIVPVVSYNYAAGDTEKCKKTLGAVGSGVKSSLLTIIRTVILFVPLGYLFSRFGINWFRMTYPVTEVITGVVGYIFYRQFVSKHKIGKTNSHNGEQEVKG